MVDDTVVGSGLYGGDQTYGEDMDHFHPHQATGECNSGCSVLTGCVCPLDSTVGGPGNKQGLPDLLAWQAAGKDVDQSLYQTLG